MALSSDLIGYLGGLRLSGGDRDGELFTVLPWQRRLCAAFSPGRGMRRCRWAGATGKSAVVVGIAAAVVGPHGPLHGRRREVVCCAASFEQSRIIFEDVAGLPALGGAFDLDDRAVWRKQDSANRAHLEYRPSGARVRCIGSDPKTAHGLRPFWCWRMSRRSGSRRVVTGCWRRLRRGWGRRRGRG